MMKKTATTAMVLALGATLAFAGPGEGKSGKRGKHGKQGLHRGAGIERLTEQLGLSDAQKEQLKAQRENFRAANQQRFATHRDTMKQLKAARAAGETERAEALRNTVELQRGEIQQLRKAQHEAMLQILTAEQRTKLAALKAEREARRGSRHDRSEQR